MSRLLVCFMMIVWFGTAVAQKNTQVSKLAVGQGISAPVSTSLVNFARGFTFQNPVGAAFNSQPVVVLEYDTWDSNSAGGASGMGGELGIGSRGVGVNLGYTKRNCESCRGAAGAAIGYNTGNFGIGLGYREGPVYSLGLLFNGSGTHRFGLTGDMHDSSVPGSDLQAYGVGYSYVGSSVVFSLDASRRTTEAKLSTDKVIRVTPGVLVRASSFALSVSYDNYLSDEGNVYEDKPWVGLGVDIGRFHLAVYRDYVSDWAIAGSFTF